MRYSLGLLAVASVFLCTYPVEAVVTNQLAVVREEVKIAQGEGREQRRYEALWLNQLALQQLDQGYWKEALKNFEQALVITKEIGERKGEGAILNNIGLIYKNLGEYTKALKY